MTDYSYENVSRALDAVYPIDISDKREIVVEILEDLYPCDIVSINNAICDYDMDSDERIFPMSELNMYLEGCTPEEVINSIDSEFDTGDAYFKDTIYGMKSANDVVNAGWVDLEGLADWIIDENNDFGFEELRDLLDSEEFKTA